MAHNFACRKNYVDVCERRIYPLGAMNDKQAEIHLLEVLKGACEQARRLGNTSVAKAALRWEQRIGQQLEKLTKPEESTEPAAA